jgi:hypothetical protein
MTKIIAILAALVLLSTAADASVSCTTRKSGCVTITTCKGSKPGSFSQCRSYKSGRVIKTSCRN